VNEGIAAVILRLASPSQGRRSFDRLAVNSFASRLVSGVAVALCGGAGALAGLWLARALGLPDVAGALVAATAGIVVATLLWILGVAVLRGVGWLK
jgi:hypothetical protein